VFDNIDRVTSESAGEALHVAGIGGDPAGLV
jgi:hypothetical protein